MGKAILFASAIGCLLYGAQFKVEPCRLTHRWADASNQSLTTHKGGEFLTKRIEQGYSTLGSWYFTDRVPLSPVELFCFAAWQMYLQAFFMGLLFFIAGTLVPGSLVRKGASGFVRVRAFRLGLPVLFYMFVLAPITEHFVAYPWNSTAPTSFANECLKHIRNGQFLQEKGPL